jgi:hypothetical protein
MSVVSGPARRRWAVVLGGVVLLAVLPVAASAVTDRTLTLQADGVPEAPDVVRRVLASADVPHTGLARTRGTLGLPQLPRLEDIASSLGAVTTARVWWSDPAAWRVDVLSRTGERDAYGTGSGLVLWDYEDDSLTDVVSDGARLRPPRADDLLPPQLARRLLAGLGPDDRVTVLPEVRRIAGVAARDLRVVPGDRRGSVARLDVWVEERTALPLALVVTDRRGLPALDARFLELSLDRPDRALLDPPAALDAERDTRPEQDLLSRLERRRSRGLPSQLAGFGASEPIVPGIRTYGSGLVRLTVVPIASGLAEQSLDAVREGGGTPTPVPGGEAVLASRGVLSVGVVRSTDGRRAYLIGGSVVPEVVLTAARQLVGTPAGGQA